MVWLSAYFCHTVLRQYGRLDCVHYMTHLMPQLVNWRPNTLKKGQFVTIFSFQSTHGDFSPSYDNALLWHTSQPQRWTVWRHYLWINSFRYQACQVIAICGRRSRCSCTSHCTVCQQTAVARVLSQPLSFWNYDYCVIMYSQWSFIGLCLKADLLGRSVSNLRCPLKQMWYIFDKIVNISGQKVMLCRWNLGDSPSYTIDIRWGWLVCQQYQN